MTTIDFAKKYLFDPLGIKDIKWEISPEGINKILNCVFDKKSLFPIKLDFGQNVITALARIPETKGLGNIIWPISQPSSEVVLKYTYFLYLN